MHLGWLWIITLLLVSSIAVANEEPVQIPQQSHPISVEESAPPPTKRKIVSIGFDYMTDSSTPGQEITQRDIPLSFAYENGATLFEISIPFIERSAPSGKVAKSHHHESRRSTSATTPIVSNQGLGDLTSSLQYSWFNEESTPFSLSSKGEVKLATADVAVGLGTGENDYFVEMLASKSLGKFNASVGLGYAIIGSPGEVEVNDQRKTLNFNNIFYSSVTGSYQLNKNLNLGLNFDFGEASETGGYEQRDVSTFVEFKFQNKQTLHFHVIKSITQGISSWGGSVVLSTLQ